jgi:mycoredoxin
VTIDNLPITVYWRPGCSSCERLRQGLEEAGIETTEINIWQDRDAAAAVRMVANGNETVPTVTIGTTVLVNPSVRAVLDHVSPGDGDVDCASAAAPHAGRAGDVAQWSLVALLVVVSFLVEAAGHSGLSWLVDGANVAIYVAIKLARGVRSRVSAGALVR